MDSGLVDELLGRRGWIESISRRLMDRFKRRAISPVILRNRMNWPAEVAPLRGSKMGLRGMRYQ